MVRWDDARFHCDTDGGLYAKRLIVTGTTLCFLGSALYVHAPARFLGLRNAAHKQTGALIINGCYNNYANGERGAVRFCGSS